MVGDDNLQLGSEESMIRCHLMVNIKLQFHTICIGLPILTCVAKTQTLSANFKPLVNSLELNQSKEYSKYVFYV